MAPGRHLSGLRPELRRRQRRWDRRPGGRPKPPPISRGSGRGRHLVHTLVRLSARGRRLRRRRLPRHRPGLRIPRGSRAPDRRSARARHPDDRGHRPEPRLGSASLVPGGAGGRPGLTGAGPLLVQARQGRGRRRDAEPLVLQLLGRAVDPDHQSRRDARRLVSPSVHPRAAGPQLGPSRRSSRTRRRPPLLVRSGRCRRAYRLGRPAREGSGSAGDRRGSGPGAASEHRPRRAPRHLPELAGNRRLHTRSRVSSSARSGCPITSASPSTSVPTSSTRPSTSTS